MGKKRKNSSAVHKETGKSLFQKHFLTLSIVAIVISAFLTYSNSFENSFQYDDVHHIIQSRHTKTFDSFKNPAYWFNFIERAPAQFTFALNYHFGEYSVKGYHVVNLLIHILTSILVFFFAGLILDSVTVKNDYIKDNKDLIRLSAALIFAVHPVQTESVTYIVQRMESLSFMFYISAMIFYFMFRKDKEYKTKYLKFLAFTLTGLLSVMTKQTAYTLPLAILLSEIYFIRDEKGKAGRKLIFSILTFLISAVIIGLAADLLPREQFSDTNRVQYMLSQFIVIPKYIFLLFIPAGQNIDHNIIVPSGYFEPGVIAGSLIIAVILYIVYYLYRKGHIILSFSIAWFFAVISLRSSILPISDLMSEHRLYPAVFGFGMFLTSFIFYITNRYARFRENRRFIPILFIAIIFIYAGTAFKRNEVWKDELSLWKDSVSKSPEKFRPNYNTAEALKKAGNSKEALIYYLKAYSLNSESYGVCNNIGNIYSGEKNYDSAEKYYLKALELNPRYPKSLNNLANVFFKKKKYKDAEILYLKSTENDPDFVDPFLNLGHLYVISERYDLAVNNYKKVLELDPDNTQARNNLSIIESRMAGQIK